MSSHVAPDWWLQKYNCGVTVAQSEGWRDSDGQVVQFPMQPTWPILPDNEAGTQFPKGPQCARLHFFLSDLSEVIQ